VTGDGTKRAVQYSICYRLVTEPLAARPCRQGTPPPRVTRRPAGRPGSPFMIMALVIASSVPHHRSFPRCSHGGMPWSDGIIVGQNFFFHSTASNSSSATLVSCVCSEMGMLCVPRRAIKFRFEITRSLWAQSLDPCRARRRHGMCGLNVRLHSSEHSLLAALNQNKQAHSPP
jgi:hypothetical protein